jgi:hypothetical protein
MGESWEKLAGGIPEEESIMSFLIDPADHMFAGTSLGGVYQSKDYGKSWNDISSGLSGSYIITMTFDKNGNIYAGTDGNGVFTSFDPMDIDRRSNAPIQLRLSPNPVRENLRIAFDNESWNKVFLYLADMNGRRIKTIDYGIHSPGKIQISLNVADLAPGAYLLRGISGSTHLEGKFTVVR